MNLISSTTVSVSRLCSRECQDDWRNNGKGFESNQLWHKVRIIQNFHSKGEGKSRNASVSTGGVPTEIRNAYFQNKCVGHFCQTYLLRYQLVVCGCSVIYSQGRWRNHCGYRSVGLSFQPECAEELVPDWGSRRFQENSFSASYSDGTQTLNPDSGILMSTATPLHVPQEGHTQCPPVCHVCSVLGIHITLIDMRSLCEAREMGE